MLSFSSTRPPDPQVIHLPSATSHPPAFATAQQASARHHAAQNTGAQAFDPLTGGPAFFDAAVGLHWATADTNLAANGPAGPNGPHHGGAAGAGRGHAQAGGHHHGSNRGQNLGGRGSKYALAALHNDEMLLSLRKRTIARFGASWIRPPGVAKTLQGMEDERAEKEEAEAMRQRELALEEEQRAMMAQEGGMEGDEEGEDGMEGLEGEEREDGVLAAGDGDEGADGEMEGMRDLDEDVPDLDAEGGLGDWEDEDEEDEAGQVAEEVGAQEDEIEEGIALQQDMGDIGLDDDEVLLMTAGGRQSTGVTGRGRAAMMHELGLTGVMSGPEGEGDGDYSNPALFSSPARRPNRLLNFNVGTDQSSNTVSFGTAQGGTRHGGGESLFTPPGRTQINSFRSQPTASFHTARTGNAQSRDDLERDMLVTPGNMEMEGDLDDEIHDGSLDMDESSADEAIEPQSEAEIEDMSDFGDDSKVAHPNPTAAAERRSPSLVPRRPPQHPRPPDTIEPSTFASAGASAGPSGPRFPQTPEGKDLATFAALAVDRTLQRNPNPQPGVGGEAQSSFAIRSGNATAQNTADPSDAQEYESQQPHNRQAQQRRRQVAAVSRRAATDHRRQREQEQAHHDDEDERERQTARPAARGTGTNATGRVNTRTRTRTGR